MASAVWMNLGSIVLGLLAWLLPVMRLVRRGRSAGGRWPVYSAASLGACAAALCLQICYSNYLVEAEDWAALSDTAGVAAFVSAFLLVSVMLLNGITLFVYYRNQTGKRG